MSNNAKETIKIILSCIKNQKNIKNRDDIISMMEKTWDKLMNSDS